MTERDLEHRLTKIEQASVALQSQVAGLSTDITGRLDHITAHIEKQNGSIAEHFAADLAWQHSHELAQAEAAGEARGRAAVLGWRDKLLLAVAGPALTAAVAGVSWLLTR